jgi:diadenosine tetraphosphate (Ap4A) HIT family hydrolase
MVILYIMPGIEDILPMFSKMAMEHSGGIRIPYKVTVDPECSFCRKNRQIYLSEDEYEHPEPTFIARLPVSVAALSYEQDYPGRTAVILRDHETSMSHLLENKLLLFVAFMEDVATVADAIYRACGPVKINYAVYMNQNDHFHMHLIPRYGWEGEKLKMPPLFRGADRLEPGFDYRSLALRIRHNINRDSSQFTEYMERMINEGLPKK